MPPLASFALVCAVAFPLAAAQPEDRVLLVDGSTFSGQLSGMHAGFVALRVSTEEGFAERRFAADAIARLQFAPAVGSASSSADLEDSAATGLEAKVLRRASYLGLLDANDEALLPDLLNHYLEDGRALEASAYIKLWLPKAEHAATRRRLGEQQILAALASDAPDEAAVFARDWIRTYPNQTASALAAHVLAETALQKGDPETAFWIALRPIAERTNPKPRFLAPCYQSAIAAAKQLGQSAYAERLATELASLEGQAEPTHDAPEAPPEDAPPQLPSLSAEDIVFPQILKSNKAHELL